MNLMLIIVTIMIILYIISYKRYKWLYIIAKTCIRDYRGRKFYSFLSTRRNNVKKHNLTVHKVFFETLTKYPDKIALIFENEKWTFTMIDEYTNKIGHYFNLQGFKRGDCIGLLYNNRPEYICIWLGLSKFGILTALVTRNLTTASLTHCLKIGNCKALIFGSDYTETVSKMIESIPNLRLYQLGEANEQHNVVDNAVDLNRALNETSNEPIEIKEHLTYKDPLLYVYTSDSCEMVGASIFNQTRLLSLGAVMEYFVKKDDVVYTPLPLNHSFSIMNVILTVTCGATMVIKATFSADEYWNDCAKHQCTHAMYIGEMCRYILNVSNEVPNHKVKIIFGSGLKSDIWEKFVEKFQIKRVLEFYSAAEGLITLINLDNKVGTIGFIPRYNRAIHSTQLVKANYQSGEPLRDPNGLCVSCGFDDPGLALGKINSDLMITFQGYDNEKLLKLKTVTDVLDLEDVYLNSGDILETDEYGYIYFRDRSDIAVRRKFENVATDAVESIINKLVPNSTAFVFGVKTPQENGTAVMLVITHSENLGNISELCRNILEHLPEYAIPLFIRFGDSAARSRCNLMSEGYNVDIVNDIMYLFDITLRQYIPLTRELYEDIQEGKLRL